MSNTYVKAAFAVTMSRADAAIIRDAETACEIIEDADENVDLAPAYECLSSPFKNAFPAREGNPFAGFFEIFDDPVYPTLDCEIEYGLPDAMGMCEVMFRGDQFGVEQVAQLLFTACKSALPCAFEFTYDCDRLRIGEFGGGAAIISDAGVTFHNTATMIQAAMGRASTASDEDDRGVVLARRDPDHGLSFWNEHGDYGRLAIARVFTDAEAGTFASATGEDQTEWLSLPRLAN